MELDQKDDPKYVVRRLLEFFPPHVKNVFLNKMNYDDFFLL